MDDNNIYLEEPTKQNKTVIYTLLFLFGLGIGVFGAYYLIVEKGVLGHTVINKLERDVTVTDTGIADAVEKLYDSVVVVSSIRSNRLIGSGTGFVYQVEGNKAYIITNHHVIVNATSIEVKFTNDKIYTVKLIGSDQYSDIAVLEIDKDKIVSVADIGSSEKLRLGDTAFTIGAPLTKEYAWTVTRGIISGKDRLVELRVGNAQTANFAMRVLQTDAAINSGNSGGPLANSNGEVIGVTNMKLVGSSVEGMGFAIPIEDAIQTANELRKGGSVARPILGVGTLDVSDAAALRTQYGITLDPSITKGAVIAFIQPNSVAAEAGLKQGDVIIKLGNYEVTSSARLKHALYRYSVGSKVDIEFIRDTKTEKINITLSQKAN